MDCIKAGFLMRVIVGGFICLLISFGQNYDVQAANSCVACHTDEEMLVESLGKDDTAKSSLQAGPG